MKRWLALLICLLTMTSVFAGAEEKQVYWDVTYSYRGYSLILHWDKALMPDEALEKMIQDVFFDKYPAIRETFGTSEERAIKLVVSAGTETYISAAEGIVIPYESLKNTPEGALNCLVWFFANIVTNGHPNPENDPEIDVLSLGLQYYTATVYAADPAAAGWLKPYEPGQQLTDGYYEAAAFLMWVAQTYGEDVPIRLNRVLCEGRYDRLYFWVWATGDTLDNLWNAYAAQSMAK